MPAEPARSPHAHHDAIPQSARLGRALVLGGGGSTGNAWMIGVIAGLSEAGVDVTRADVIVGTSAGETTAVQILSVSPAKLLAETLSAAPLHRSSHGAAAAARGTTQAVVGTMDRTQTLIDAADSAGDMRRKLGASALGLDAMSDGSGSARWRAIVAARLPSQEWPAQTVLIPAVDARTGEPVVFDRDGGVDLVDAIAASTSSGPPFRIGRGRFLDGGYRRNENADLALGYGQVVVLSPFGGRTRYPLHWRMHLAAQVEDLRAAGALVEVIMPDRESEHLFGVNAMDPALRRAAAQVGYRQGKAHAKRLSAFWS
ncbi:MAG: patatin-like phospholipase family protein [Thermomicrobiales bacterium]